MIAKILKETFGDSLVRAELRDGEFFVVGFEGRDKVYNSFKEGGVVDVETLPSPEELKGKILLKVGLPSLALYIHAHRRVGKEPIRFRQSGHETEGDYC